LLFSAPFPRLQYRLSDMVPKQMNSKFLVSELEFNVPFQHKYGYIRDKFLVTK